MGVCVCVLNSVQFIKQQRTKDHLQVASTYNTVIAHRVPTMYTQYVASDKAVYNLRQIPFTVLQKIIVIKRLVKLAKASKIWTTS